MKSIKFGLLVTLFLFFGCSEQSNKLPETKSSPIYAQNLSQLSDILAEETNKNNPSDILVVFDFNYTLLYPTDAAMQKKNTTLYYSDFNKLLGKLSKEEANVVISNSTKSPRQNLVNSNLPNFIDNYMAKGVDFIVCTGSLTKTNGVHSADIISDVLRKNRITLHTTRVPSSEFEFQDIKPYLNAYPLFKNNIITANKQEKGTVLSSFLRKLSKAPKVLIFVDNSKKKVHSVLKIAKEFPDIKLIAVVYSEYKTINVETISKKAFIDYWMKNIELTVKDFRKRLPQSKATNAV